MSERSIVALTTQVVRDAEGAFSSAGVSLRLAAHDPGTSGAGLRLDAESPRGIAQLVVWETGEADLVIGELQDGTVVMQEHREITSEVGASDAVATILRLLGTEPVA